MNMRDRGLTFLFVVAVLVGGCTTHAPEVDVRTPLPKGTDPLIYVTSARQKERVIGALNAAGFHLVDAPADGVYLLRVTVGIEQGSRPCGTLNNVRLSLRRQEKSIVEAEAKGWTGSCQPNVFDDVSRALRARIVDMTDGGHA